jgi:hypothetical protein
MSKKPEWYEVHQPARCDFVIGLQDDGTLSDPDAETNRPPLRFQTAEEAEAAARAVLASRPDLRGGLDVVRLQKRTSKSAWIRGRKRVARG